MSLQPWQLKIRNSKVVKSTSAYSGLTCFIGYFKFDHMVVELNLTNSRKEYEIIESIELKHDDCYKAQVKALEYLNLLSNIKNVLYTRATSKDQFDSDYWCGIYTKDETSPTGVIRAGSCLMKYAELMGWSTLSPTEMKCSAH